MRFGKELVILFLLIAGIGAGCIGERPTTQTPTPTPETPVTQTPTPTPAAPPKITYEGTIYVSGMGGHFARADVVIDPENEAAPITVKKLKRVVLGDKKKYATHDPRIDADRKIMYWSAYVNDSGKVHYGTINLETNKKAEDRTIDIDPRVTKKPMYCASGQSNNEYLPIFMGYEGYVDVFDKDTLNHKVRVFLDGPDFPVNYKFYHGVNTPDMRQMLLTTNGADKPHGTVTGEVHLFLLDMNALVNGEAKVLKKAKITGAPKTTIAFRQTFTSDGKYLLQSGRDRFFLIDAETLTVIDEEMMPEGWENHDAIPTPDNKYAILTVRVPVDVGAEKPVKDGQIWLYDIEAKKIIGEPVSTCIACHQDLGEAEGKNAILCGLDALWKETEETPTLGCM
jgi:hypothetical protein